MSLSGRWCFPCAIRASGPVASLVTIFVERIYDMTAVALMFAINLLWFRPQFALEVSFDRVRLAGVIMLGAVILGIVFLMWFRKRSSLVIDFCERLFARWRFIPQRLSQLRSRDARTTCPGIARARRLSRTGGNDWLDRFDLARHCRGQLLVMRAFHLQVGLSETIFVLGWSLVGSLVPTPGGAAGAFHAATAAGLLFLGVKKEMAAALSIVLHLVDFGPALLFGIFYLIRGDLSVAKLRAMISPTIAGANSRKGSNLR